MAHYLAQMGNVGRKHLFFYILYIYLHAALNFLFTRTHLQYKWLNCKRIKTHVFHEWFPANMNKKRHSKNQQNLNNDILFTRISSECLSNGD